MQYEVQVYSCGRWHSYENHFTILEMPRHVPHSVQPASAEAFADAAIHSGALAARIIELNYRGPVTVMEMHV